MPSAGTIISCTDISIDYPLPSSTHTSKCKCGDNNFISRCRRNFPYNFFHVAVSPFVDSILTYQQFQNYCSTEMSSQDDHPTILPAQYPVISWFGLALWILAVSSLTRLSRKKWRLELKICTLVIISHHQFLSENQCCDVPNHCQHCLCSYQTYQTLER